MGKQARQKRARRGSGAEPAAPAEHGRPGAPPRRQPRFEWPRWPERGERLAWPLVAGVFLLALAVRVLFLSQMTRTPYLEIDTIDARGYQLWADQILGGEWLPRRHFYQSPLYAYYLAGVYALFGRSEWAPRVIQVLLGSASAALLAVIGARLFSRRVGLIAGVLLATYGPMVLEEISIAKTVLLIFGGLLAFLLFLRARERRHAPTMAAAGAIFGITVIGVGQWLVGLFGLALWAAVDRSLPRPLARRLAGVFLAAALLALAPIVVWNSYFGGGFLLTSADAGLNLYLGNNPLSTGLTGRPRGLRDVPEYEESDSRQLAEREAGRALTPAGVSRHWSRRALGWAIGNPGTFLDTTRKKLTVLWNSYEIPDSYHFSFIRAQYIPWLWLAGTFAVVGPLGLIGLVLAAGHRPARPLYVVCLGYLAVITLFYVRSRYRMPALPFLMIFAAAAIDWTLGVLGREDWRPAAAIAAGALVAGVFVNQTYCEPPRRNAPAICLGRDVWFDLEWQKLAEWHERQGDVETAVGYLHRAAAGESLRGPGPLFLWMGRLELHLAERAREAGHGVTAASRLDLASAALTRALSYAYRPHEAQTYLATVYRLQGRTDDAIAASDAAVRARPGDATVVLSALRLRAALGRCDQARRLRDELVRYHPGDTRGDDVVATCGS